MLQVKSKQKNNLLFAGYGGQVSNILVEDLKAILAFISESSTD